MVTNSGAQKEGGGSPKHPPGINRRSGHSIKHDERCLKPCVYLTAVMHSVQVTTFIALSFGWQHTYFHLAVSGGARYRDEQSWHLSIYVFITRWTILEFEHICIHYKLTVFPSTQHSLQAIMPVWHGGIWLGAVAMWRWQILIPLWSL